MARGISISRAANQWLASGERGISSDTIFQALTGLMINQYGPDVPHDPADFRRCALLLEAVPAWRKRLPEVAVYCRQWKPFVEHWDELCALLELECPQWRAGNGSAPQLFKRICELRGIGG